MTISIGSTSFGANIHGTPSVPPWEYDRTLQSFFGITGELMMLGAAKGRQITIMLQLTGYSSHYLLQTAVAEMAALLGAFGTLEVDLGGGDVSTFPLCTFEGFFPEEDPWRDGSGANGWQQRGQLRFRQAGQ